MAITKTIFTAKNITNSLAEIGAWLTANAEVLGFAVSIDDDGTVLCTNEKGTDFLKFIKGDASHCGIMILLDNGQRLVYSGETGAPNYWTTGYVCDNGIALFAMGSEGHETIFIGKTENGSFCVIHQRALTKLRVCYGDIERGVDVTDSMLGSAKTEVYQYTNGKSSPRTSFVPICFDSGDTAKTMFFTPQTQYIMSDFGVGLEEIISDGKDEYVYSGIIAMKG